MHSVILEPSELGLLRAALRFWRDEMSPHDRDVARPYFSAEDEPVDGGYERTDRLLRLLAEVQLRYFIVDEEDEQGHDVTLLDAPPVRKTASSGVTMGTALLPKDA